MGHNSVVSSYPKSIGIPQVDGLSIGPPSFGVSQMQLCFVVEFYLSCGPSRLI